ncbi:amidohydrolase [Halobaculum magnesiiphilum]|uniref:5-methylthioadenosine/S-adenosylhomocysteine deaminase n=1 Tax=Halobaculum magnesiiphilum TaxID=1017351 RepID=A0A8T8W9G5_9EURY|nr:amidohydrolase [Halobaculum magnesiiphilum]QZP36489.1 amidohydrolase [Halobaculum magnesiiphilum]
MTDTLAVTDGRVLTPEFDVVRADVLIDADAGEILEVAPDLAGDADRTLDATDSLVMPGLVNAHGHATMTLLRGYADDKNLEDWLQEDIWPAEAELTPADVGVGTRLAAVELIRSGTTAFADMYFHVGEVVEAVREAGLRARVGHGVVTVGKDEPAAREDFAESVAVAEEYDGAADGRVRTAVMPHAPHTVGTEYFEEFVPRVREAGVPLHFHLNETETYIEEIDAEAGVRPTEYAADLGLLAEDTFVAHGVHLDDDEIETLAERDTSVVHCPASNMKLASGMAPVQDMLDAGVTVALGTDGAASNNDLDLFDELRDAAMIGKLAADDAAAVDAETAVRMATAGGAEALGFDSGRIEAGANADLAVVDLESVHLTPEHDLVSHLAYATRGSDVRHTVCDGEVLMRDREVLAFDENDVRERAQEHAEALVARAEE